MKRFVLAIFIFCGAVLVAAPGLRAESMAENSALGYRMVLPDGWTSMNRAEIKLLNDYMADAFGTRLQGTDLEVVAGYRPIGTELSYPFITVGANQRGKVVPVQAEAFNNSLLGNTAALLDSGVFHPQGSSDDITEAVFDQERWRYTITAQPGVMVHRYHYVYTSMGCLVFRAFFDQRSMRQLPEVDASLRSVTLHEHMQYVPGERRVQQRPTSSRNFLIIYAMALLVLIGFLLTDFRSDEEDHHTH